jgi:hypothetical protein
LDQQLSESQLKPKINKGKKAESWESGILDNEVQMEIRAKDPLTPQTRVFFSGL